MSLGQHDHLDRPPSRSPDLFDDQAGPLLQRDQPQPLALEQRLERRGHHAAVPGTPVQGHDPALGKPPRRALGPLVERFVCRRVGHLAGPAEASGRG